MLAPRLLTRSLGWLRNMISNQHAGFFYLVERLTNGLLTCEYEGIDRVFLHDRYNIRSTTKRE